MSSTSSKYLSALCAIAVAVITFTPLPSPGTDSERRNYENVPNLAELRGDIAIRQLPASSRIATYKGQVWAMSTDAQGKYIGLIEPPTLIEAATGKEIELEKESGALYGLNWMRLSPDGTYVMTGFMSAWANPPEPEACAWETKSGKVLKPFWLGWTRAAFGRFTRDGQYFVHHNCDGWIYVRDTKTWEIRKKMKAIGGIMCFLDLSADGRYLIASNYGGQVKLFDLSEDTPVGRNIGDVGEGYISAISPDGTIIANWEIIFGKVHLRATKDGQLLRTIRARNNGFSMEFSPDGRWLITCGFSGVAVWDVSKEQEHCKFVAQQRCAAACFAQETDDMYLAGEGNIYRLKYR
ncbi:MAG: WD40 repeat domain-containing protein [Gemmatales bacterium]|nr:WD40 repeat domain-containing protein [Gemmatales bacterium]